MAYSPKTWVCGETITADGLNNIEEGIQDALDCCEDKGFECTESQETVFEGSLTTASMGQMYGATFTPTEPIEGDSITVTFNGTEYELPKETLSFGTGYGEFDANGLPVFTNYPCVVEISSGYHLLFTPSAGTYQVVINTTVLTVETSECFEKAVKSVSDSLKYVKDAPADNGGVIENAVDLNVASGANSHAEGERTTASGDISHAEGFTTQATAMFTHAEGQNTTASQQGSHAEGQGATASGAASHAEGSGTTASNTSCHAEGDRTVASGQASHAQNHQTIAQGFAQTAIGKFNVAQGNSSSASNTDYAFIIGNGSGIGSTPRSNALAIKWDGTFVFANGTEITPAQFASLLALL